MSLRHRLAAVHLAPPAASVPRESCMEEKDVGEAQPPVPN